jgi:hypothetical protein
MNCFVCKKELKPGDSVQLRCSCPETVCQSCAGKQLLKLPETYESCISCPSCGLSCKPQDKEGVQEAIDAEHEIILHAFKLTDADHSPSEKDIKFVKLRKCFNELQKLLKLGLPQDLRREPAKKDNPPLHIVIKELRYKISTLMKEHRASTVGDIPHPVDLITFTRNVHIESVLERDARMQPPITPDRACCVCTGEIASGQSVLLTCACIVCRGCALNGVMDYDDTFHTGELPCPNPGCAGCISTATSLFTLRNVPSLEKWENGLVVSAAAYFSPLLPAFKRISKHTLALLVRWFEAFGYLEHATTTALIGASEERMRLRIAMLEERRLNDVGLLHTMSRPTTDAEARWGFLRGADIPHNSILERLVLQLGESSNTASGSSPSSSSSSSARRAGGATTAAHMSVAERVELGLRGLADAKESATGFNACNALEKLVWVAAFTHREAAVLMLTYLFRTAEEICTAVEVVLRGMSRALGSVEHKKARERIKDAIAEGKVLSLLHKKRLIKLDQVRLSYSSYRTL